MGVEVTGRIGTSTYADSYIVLDGADVVVRCARTHRLVGRHQAGTWHEAMDGAQHICAVVPCPPVLKIQQKASAA